MRESNINKTKTIPSEAKTGVNFVYSDMRMVLLKNRRIDPQKILADFENKLTDVLGQVWLPTFNYDFTKCGVYDVDNDAAQTGTFNEYIRSRYKSRTLIPVLNVVKVGYKAAHGNITDLTKIPESIDLFRTQYVFEELCAANGLIIWFCVNPFKLASVTHLAETKFGGVPYRYDKEFTGLIRYMGTEKQVRVTYNLRPPRDQFQVDYSSETRIKLYENVLNYVPNFYYTYPLYYARSRDLLEIYIHSLTANSLSLLDDKSRIAVEKHLKKNSQLKIEHFES